jgi:Werner syndrome ATP-dependent helicase
MKDYLKTLKKWFKFDNFRDKQFEIIDAIINKKQDVCGILFTGAGKSLCYQFPAVHTKKVVLVVSPLIALINDQITQLERLNISTIALNGTVSNKGFLQKEILKNKYRVVYSTPEYLVNQEDFMQNLIDEDILLAFCIDESHCISSWGNDFRPSYKELSKLKTKYPTIPIMALTATATPVVQQDIIDTLQLEKPLVIKTTFDRPNLLLKVIPKSSHPKDDLLPLLKNSNDRTIIYCQTRKDTEFLSELLQQYNIKAGSYHAGMSTIARELAHEEFESLEINVLTASVAYGLGVNLTIRNIIHYGPPGDLETYYQAVGRAGRDHKPSFCYLLYKLTDFSTNDFFINQVSNITYRKHRLKLAGAMKKFIYSTECRRKTLLAYFGEEYLKDNCKNCDICLSNRIAVQEDLTKETSLLIQVTEDTEDTYGGSMLVSILRGSNSKKIKPKFKKISCYNAGSHRTEQWWKLFIRLMINREFLKEKSISHGYGFTLSRTKAAKNWMKEEDRSMVMTLPKDMQSNIKSIPTITTTTPTTTTTTTTTTTIPTTTTINTKDTAYKTFDMFQNKNMSLTEIAEARDIQAKTVDEHIFKAYERGYKLDLKKLKYTDKVYKIIKKVLQDNPDITLLRSIKSKIANSLTYLDIKITQHKMKLEAVEEEPEAVEEKPEEKPPTKNKKKRVKSKTKNSLSK